MSYKTLQLGGISPKEVGENIKKARTEAQLTAAQLGDRIGVSHVTVLSVEKGEKLSRQTLVALAKELNNSFSVTWLQEHLTQSVSEFIDFNELFERKVREIVIEELQNISKKSDVKLKSNEVSEEDVPMTGNIGGLPSESDVEVMDSKSLSRRKKAS